MAAAHDATSTTLIGFGSGSSFTHTPVGTPTIAIVRIGWIGFPNVVATVTYGGQSMTALSGGLARKAIGGYDVVSQIFYKVSPLTGTQSVAFSFDQGSNAGAVAASTYTGADSFGTPLLDALGTANASFSTLTVTDGVAGDIIIDAIGVDTGATTITPSNTSRMNLDDGGYLAGAQDADGSASVALTWTLGVTTHLAHVAVALKQTASFAALLPIFAASTRVNTLLRR